MSLYKNTFYATFISLLIKVTSVLYVIPFELMVSNYGGALFSYAYIPFTIVLQLSILGIPGIISRLVSAYRSKNQADVARYIFFWGTKVTFIISSLFAILFIAFAKPIAYLIPNKLSQINPDVLGNVLMISALALFIVPVLATCRGLINGFMRIKKVSNSQLIDHVFRISFILVGSYFAIFVFKSHTLKESINNAIYLSVFASVIGSVAALLYLLPVIIKISKIKNKVKLDNSIKKDIKNQIIKLAIPNIILSLDLPFYQLIDTMTFNHILSHSSIARDTDIYFSVFSFYSIKIILIMATIANSFNLTLSPKVSEYFTHGKLNEIRKIFYKSFATTLTICIPLIIIMMFFGNNIYAFFYKYSKYANNVIGSQSWLGLLYGLYIMITTIMLSMKMTKQTTRSVSIGLLTKLILMFPMTYLLSVQGAIWSTNIAIVVSLSYIINEFKKYIKLSYKKLFGYISIILVYNVITVVIVCLAFKIIWHPDYTRLMSFLYLFLICGFSFSSYFIVIWKDKFIKHLRG